MDLMERVVLSLPSEAQWERGARAGSDTPWWTGAERESLRGQVNLADQTAKKAGVNWPDMDDWSELEDGSVIHSEVGRYPPNTFGLHEVAGNLWEWCLDGYDGDGYGRSPKEDPVSDPEGSPVRVARGGSFSADASRTRSAFRRYVTPGSLSNDLGLRPARGITP
jgi:formylglycine-generating enzyme required for sulfatase activity